MMSDFCSLGFLHPSPSQSQKEEKIVQMYEVLILTTRDPYEEYQKFSEKVEWGEDDNQSHFSLCLWEYDFLRHLFQHYSVNWNWESLPEHDVQNVKTKTPDILVFSQNQYPLHKVMEIYQPKILILLSDEWGEISHIDYFTKDIPLVLTQYYHSHYHYGKNTFSIVPGFIQGFFGKWNKTSHTIVSDSKCLKNKNRKYQWSCINMNIDSDIVAIFDQIFSDNRMIEKDTSLQNERNVYQESIFVLCTKGNSNSNQKRSIDNFRIYHAILCGAIPVLSGCSISEYQSTFSYLPKLNMIFEETWEAAAKKCKQIDQQKIKIMQNENLVAWRTHIDRTQSLVEKILSDPKSEKFEVSSFLNPLKLFPFLSNFSNFYPMTSNRTQNTDSKNSKNSKERKKNTKNRKDSSNLSKNLSNLEEKEKVTLTTLQVFVINRKQDTSRKERMTWRLAKLDQTKVNIHFIEAMDNKDEIKAFISNDKGKNPSIPEGGCLMSHLTALQRFLIHSYSSPQSQSQQYQQYALILEDDTVLLKSFESVLDPILSILPTLVEENQQLCLLSCYHSYGGVEREWSKEITKKYKMLPIWKKGLPLEKTGIFSTAAYLISSSYAEKCCNQYSAPLQKWKSLENQFKITSEIITLQSNGVFIWPPVVIEECVETHIQPLPIQMKFNYWKSFGVNNFAEEEDPVRMIWKEKGYDLS